MKTSYKSIFLWGLLAVFCIVVLSKTSYASQAGPGEGLPQNFSDGGGGIIYMGASDREQAKAIAAVDSDGVISDTPAAGEEGAAAGSAQSTADAETSGNEAQTAAAGGQTVKDGDYFIHDGVKYQKGDLVGNFKLSGYDNNACCVGSNAGGATYSGKMPRVNHTVAADLSVLPLGTVIIVEGTKGKTVHNYDGVYQVEDMGGGVSGNHLDIYCASHKEAAAVTDPGWQYSNVWLAVPVEE